MKGEYMGVKALEKNVRVLWIDTEQASQTSRAVCRGIELMCGFEPSDARFIYFALREYPDRQEMTEAMRMLFNEYCPDIAIVDGIRDFIPDFNDIVESSEIVLECMRLSSGVSAELAQKKGLQERPPCCVCCILHQNKPKDDNNMRGHLGTELSNKAGEVWEATQDDDHVFSFAQTRSRTRPVDTPLRYKVVSRNYVDIEHQKSEEIGIPRLWEPTEADAVEEVEKVKNFQTSFGWKPLTQETANRMFYTIMGYADWNYNKLKAKFCEFWGVSYPMFGKLYSMTDHHVYDVTINGVKFYRYNGPKFD